MKKLNSIFREQGCATWFFGGLICLLPLVLFFSYEPVISLGNSESMNFELSLPLIWLVLFDLTAFLVMAKKKMLFKGLKKKWLWLLLPIYLTLSVLWSLNSLRGVLTVGILWLIYFAIDAMASLKNVFTEVGYREKFWKWFFGAAILVCGWCWVQCVLDLVGVGRETSLICAGCTYEMFGFPHPDGFAIEPQFMGNLLLAPAIVAAWMVMISEKRSSRKGVLLFVTVATLFLTFSRGAIYALVIGLMGLTIGAVAKEKTKRKEVAKRSGTVWLLVVLAFGFTLNLQGVMAAVSPTDDTYVSGVEKVINHLSLGVIDMRSDEAREENDLLEKEELTEVGLVEKPVENFAEEEVDSGAKKAVFDGYVAESTDTRLRLTGAAVQIWKQNPQTALIGVGLGGAGQALYINGLSPAPKEIVQNEYASLLLETGIIGVLLAILTMFLIIRIAYKNPAREMVLALTIAYAVTLGFFSGLPNALQVYLLPAVLMVLGEATVRSKKD